MKVNVDVGEIWESVEYNILARIFPNRVIQELEIKLSYDYWAPYIGKYTRHSKIVLNTEHKKNKQSQWKLLRGLSKDDRRAYSRNVN